MRINLRRIAFPVSLVVLMLVAAAPSYGTLAVPVVTGPTNGGTFDALPLFSWNAVSGAAEYTVQVADNPGFASLASYTTNNTRFTLPSAKANGTYYWRVQAVTSGGSQSAWSTSRSFVLDWADQPNLTAPADTSTVTYPTPVLLQWSAVPYAESYSVSIYNDSNLSTPVTGFPITTNATSYAPTSHLVSGNQYWWTVTPIDSGNLQGTTSNVQSFYWSWPTTSNLTVTDLDSSPQVFDPQFSWDPIPGADQYQVQVNSDAGFSGSPAYTGTTIGTSLTPQTLLPAGTYYWRVRAVDSGGNFGVWNVYSSTFTIAYDTGSNAIPGLTMLDYTTDQSNWSQGYSTSVPIVSWDPVPGASSYEVQITLFNTGICNWSQGSPNEWDDVTAATNWTPLGTGWNGNKPYPANHNVSSDSSALVASDSYCVRVRALRNTDSNFNQIYGTWSSLGDGNSQASFTYSGPPSGNPCTQPCNTNYLGAADYLGPVLEAGSTTVPLFTWNPLAGKQSYYVIVATDPSFQHVIDYAFTQLPAYAPRNGTQWTTYPDSNTDYYWAVLPATGIDGSFGAGDPTSTLNYPQTFQVHSDPPTLISPANQSQQAGEPTFQWTPVDGAYYYVLNVTGPNGFSQTVQTDETSYTGNTTYLAGSTYTWSVYAVDRALTPMAVSASGTFEKTLAAPTFTTVTSPANPTSSNSIPIWEWDAMPGAVAYDIRYYPPTGSASETDGLTTTAFVPKNLAQTGIFKWQVRAEYPTLSSIVDSAWSPLQTFSRSVATPVGLSVSSASHAVVFSWTPENGAATYNVQVATNSSFTANVKTWTGVLQPPFAPDLTNIGAFTDGGTLYWQVQSIDGDNNQSAYTAPLSFTQPMLLTASSSGSFMHGVIKTVTITVKNGYNAGVSGVSVKGVGAGLTTLVKKTGSTGNVAFALKPKKAGTITFTVSKAGCITTTIKVLVG